MARAANAVRPRLARAAETVRPHLARAARTVGPRLEQAAAAAKPQLARMRRTREAWPKTVRTWQYTAGATTAGLALAATVVTAAGPWDSSGQRTAEVDHAVALERTGGTDHGRSSDTSDTSDTAAGMPRPAPSAASVLTGLGGSADTVRGAS